MKPADVGENKDISKGKKKPTWHRGKKRSME
jgi:hypothetical protein